MEQVIMEHFMEVHSLVEDLQWEQFPEFQLDDYTIAQMAKNVNIKKAVGNDGIHPQLFNLARHKGCKGKKVFYWCNICKSKLLICRTITDKKYWQSNWAERSKEGRLILLNKVFLKCPSVKDYRPIDCRTECGDKIS